MRAVTSGSTSNNAVIRMLSDLGITSNANDNTLTSVDTTKLQNALTNNLSEVQALFNDPATGLTNTVQSVIAGYNDSLNGVIINEQNSIKQQINFNNQQITRMQENMAAEQTNLQNEFAMLDSVIASGTGLSSIFSGNSSSGGATATTSSSPSSFGSVGTSSPSS